MSEVLTQADPYVHSNLFSRYYLRERVDDLEARPVFMELSDFCSTELESRGVTIPLWRESVIVVGRERGVWV
jgi:hypothetical protein